MVARHLLVAVHVILLLWGREGAWSCPAAWLLLNGDSTALHEGEALLAPVLAPGVADNPIEALLTTR